MDHTIATHLLSQQEMARRLGLNVTDLTCFAFILEAGEDLLTAGDLAERAGYITRRPDPNDRRRVRVAAQPAAVARVHALYEPYYARLAVLIADYSPAEVAVLTDWFTRQGELARAYMDEIRETDT